MEDELIPSYQLREAKEEVEALKKMLEAGGGRQEDLLKYRKLVNIFSKNIKIFKRL